ncbi:hypothetical protein GCM10010151_39850 [Actinoallomurus spadix]|uniref:DUF2752 domain-containing protein n=2 Tax=Actinoallomurus spadix TaxID=79912 RepID=A0ABN0WTB1_9ACTN
MDVARGTRVTPGAPTAPARMLASFTAAAGDGVRGVAIRTGSMAVAAVLAALVHRAHDPGILCPLRRFTGVPCPLCGGTTVFMELGAAHPVRAVLANPFALAGALGLATAPLGIGHRWWAIESRARAALLGVVVVLSWLWQLARFGLLQW